MDLFMSSDLLLTLILLIKTKYEEKRSAETIANVK